MKRSVPGLLAGLVATAALAAPALAAPANVTVRVEGDAARRSCRAPRSHDRRRPRSASAGRRPAPGTSALRRARPGDGRRLDGHVRRGLRLPARRVKGETHDDPPRGPGAYWSFWINYTHATPGICGQELQEGDDVLVVAGLLPPTDAARRSTPLRLTGVPATVAPGACGDGQGRRVRVSPPTRRHRDDGRAGRGRHRDQPAARRPPPGRTARRRSRSPAPVRWPSQATKAGTRGPHRRRDLRDDRRRRRLRHAARRRARRSAPARPPTRPRRSPRSRACEAGKVFSRRKAPARALGHGHGRRRRA